MSIPRNPQYTTKKGGVYNGILFSNGLSVAKQIPGKKNMGYNGFTVANFICNGNSVAI